MESHAHGFYQRTDLRREQSGRNHFLPRQHDVLHHGTIALHTQRLVVLAGIDTLVTTGGTFTTVGVRITGYHHAWLQSFRHAVAYCFDDGSHLMTWDHRVQCHGIAPHEGIDVRTAEAHIVQLQQYLALARRLGFLNVDDIQLLCVCDLYCFHSDIFLIYGNSGR